MQKADSTRPTMNRTCEMLRCQNLADRQYTLAPGTNLWLCASCALQEGLRV